MKGKFMISADEIISEVNSLPIEIRAKIIDKLLKSLSPNSKRIDEMWVAEAEKRVEQIKSGKVETISGEEVFKKVRNKIGK